MSNVIQNRYDFVLFYDVKNGNPNGDPDAGNMPRIDPETGMGIVTDVCLKRKIRNYVDTVKDGQEGYEIYVKSQVTLNRNDLRGGSAVGVEEELRTIQEGAATAKTDAIKKLKSKDPDIDVKLRDAMCSTFYDIRTFGAVMTTYVKAALNCGQVRGPVQLGFSQSVEPVIPREITITRVAITTEADAEKKSGEMGNKHIIPYGLYRCEGYISANLARKTTGFSEEDLELFWEALTNMFEFDRSASRGNMAMRKLIIFKHDSELGNAPSHKLFDLVTATRKNNETFEPARSVDDYVIAVDESTLPEGVQVEIRD